MSDQKIEKVSIRPGDITPVGNWVATDVADGLSTMALIGLMLGNIDS